MRGLCGWTGTGCCAVDWNVPLSRECCDSDTRTERRRDESVRRRVFTQTLHSKSSRNHKRGIHQGTCEHARVCV
ncbi:hypothetical protein JOB18_000825 [Solea senegalensis]|uniref:Secreted protein n=1 Tax=Solea senegalensis TaxID=28829 RepID=A0AAV6PR50_SOLSE|nr:hypothetical protein JOB18_000825 [Solea senegalensis]